MKNNPITNKYIKIKRKSNTKENTDSSQINHTNSSKKLKFPKKNIEFLKKNPKLIKTKSKYNNNQIINENNKNINNKTELNVFYQNIRGKYNQRCCNNPTWNNWLIQKKYKYHLLWKQKYHQIN